MADEQVFLCQGEFTCSFEVFSFVVDEFTRCMSNSPGGPDKSRFIFYISVPLGCKEKNLTYGETLNLLTAADKIVPFSTSLV